MRHGAQPQTPPPLVEGEDFYLEGAALVFTARYHLKRGYCCESGCRHCPYRAARGSETEAGGATDACATDTARATD